MSAAWALCRLGGDGALTRRTFGQRGSSGAVVCPSGALCCCFFFRCDGRNMKKVDCENQENRQKYITHSKPPYSTMDRLRLRVSVCQFSINAHTLTSARAVRRPSAATRQTQQHTSELQSLRHL